jgi:tRNA (adenine37-N6)-methyltransferase
VETAFTVHPIGVVRSPFREKVEAPRQAAAARGVAGAIEIRAEHVHALSDLEGFERIWVLFWFDRAAFARSKVLPPRSDVKRGVFATRSPHRPNPIGMSAVRLERVCGTTLHVRDLDILDGTPVLDLKPYLPYADAFPESGAGWLEAPDPRLAWEVRLAAAASEQLAWIAERSPLPLRARIVETLSLGPQPHPYRRIRNVGGELTLAVKEWRVRFRVEGNVVLVERLHTGFRPRELARGDDDEVRALHRAFVARFG